MFLIHPSQLEQGRKRCAPARAAVAALEREIALCCNACGSPRNAIVSATDRYGLPLRTAVCLDCGLFYLVDRLTAPAYARFYGDGAYRAVSSQFLGSRHSIGQIQANQVAYARGLIRAIHGYVPPRDGARLLDVGGSTGVVAREVAGAFGLQPTVLDPSADETQAARALGIEAVTGSLESWESAGKFQFVLLCRSVEHLLDLRAALGKIRSLLEDGGLFYCDIADFVELCRLVGPPEAVTKIDHCYWLTAETAPDLFRALGFEIVSMNLVFHDAQVGFLLRPCPPRTGSSAEARVRDQIRTLQRIERDWREYGRQAAGSADWVRRKAYRMKRRLARMVPAKWMA